MEWIGVLIVSIIIVGIVVVLICIALVKSTKTYDNNDIHYVQKNNAYEHFDFDQYEIQRFGAEGENYVADHLLGLVKHFNGVLFNDFCFEDDDGFSSEIDHIVVTRGGIFVIETKTNKGTIQGNKDDDYWLCIKEIYQEDKTFKNPIKQNIGHINHLRKVFGNNCPKMESIVIFPIADLSSLECNGVYSLKGAIEYLKHRSLEAKYSEDFVKKASDKLMDIKNQYGISKEQHIRNINKKLN